MTTYGITLLGGNQEFSIEKARRELGYEPQFDVIRGVCEGVKWYLAAKKDIHEGQKQREVAQTTR